MDEILYFPAPDDVFFPLIETDNPEYDLEKTKDAVAICAKSIFGIDSLFPWQRLAIANILDAVHAIESQDRIATTDVENSNLGIIQSLLDDLQDETVDNDLALYDEDGICRGKQIILLPTGAGKSLCFQVPALLLNKPTLIVYPLLALMSDQCRRMEEVGLDPVLLRGGQSKEERKKQLDKLLGNDGNNPSKLIIANPEILASKEIIDVLSNIGIAHFTIDEAHCVSEWGDSFRPAYLDLKTAINKIKPLAVTAFTATASPHVLSRITNILFDGKANIVKGESDRPNIKYFVRHCRVKFPALLEEINNRKLPLVIFCGTRNRTEFVAGFLKYSLHNDNIRFYHAGLDRAEKDCVEKWFHNSDNAILVTTCAWGMGVDKKNVRTVIHLDPSPTVESYIQEAGRAGRDRQTAEAVLLWSDEDKKRILEMPKKQQLRAKVMIEYTESGRCRREVLLEALGEEKAMSKKDMEGIVCSGCDICNKTAIQYSRDEKIILTFIRHHNKIFSQQELVSVIKSECKYWRAKDINILITKLISEEKIKELNPILWQSKLKIVG